MNSTPLPGTEKARLTQNDSLGDAQDPVDSNATYDVLLTIFTHVDEAIYSVKSQIRDVSLAKTVLKPLGVTGIQNAKYGIVAY